MGKGSPKSPDPVTTANAQASANKEAILESARVNQIGTWGPQGRTYYTGEVGSPDRTLVTELSPEMQGVYDSQMKVGQTLGGASEALADKVAGMGSFSYAGLPSAGSTTRTNLDLTNVPGQDKAFQIDRSGVPSLNRVDMGNVSDAPWLGDRSAQIDSLEKATYDRAYGRLQPTIDEQRAALETRLANQGIGIGTEAYDTEMSRFDRNLANQLNDLSLGAVQAGRAEDSRLYELGLAGRGMSFGEENQLFQNSLAANQNAFGQEAATQAFNQSEADRMFGQRLAGASFASQEDQRQFNNQNQLRAQAAAEALTERQVPMNDLAAILQGSPAVSAPAAVSPGSYQIQAPDTMGATYANYNQQASNAAAQRQGLYSLLGTAAGFAFSDRRLKRDIRKVGALPNGLNLYKFRYTWSDDEETGLMADEVRKIRPEAVMRVGSHDMVNYAEALA